MEEEKFWKVLIVDDDEQTHLVTKMALRGTEVLERGIEFFDAYDSSQAYEILEQNRDMTVILLDVVMETDHAGLDLVRRIRKELELLSVRIIIRTGQAGEAPELEVIQTYDINDYKMKSELTRTRLVSSLVSAIRSYVQFETLDNNRRGMERIITSSRELFLSKTVSDFSNRVISQIEEILSSTCNVCICLKRKSGMAYVKSANRNYERYIGLSLEELGEEDRASAEKTFSEESPRFIGGKAFLYIPNDHIHSGVIVINADHSISAEEQQLLNVFAVQISVGFENQYLLDRLHKSAYFDPLCQLPNRTSFLDEILRRQSEDKNQNIALIDVIQFSEINNSMGYPVGDSLLRTVAERLSHFCRDKSFIARLGGDTFAIIGPNETVVPEKLLALFGEPFEIGGDLYPVKATIGMIEMDIPDMSPQDLVQKADMALRSAKKAEGVVCHYYDREMDRSAKSRILITKDLKRAIDSDEMLLHFQPQLDLITGKLNGVESLIRWQKGKGELIPPSSFVPVAEQSGLIINIGEIAFRKSLAFLERWIKEGFSPFRIGVNVSVRQFLGDDFQTFLSESVGQYAVDPSLIELEITESILMHDLDKGIRIMKHAKDLGMSIAIDDFGTGFSSLSYLQKLPIDRLKIDRSFIMNLEHDTKAQKLTQMIVQLGKQLNLELIAEGVETEEQLGFLRALECDEVQGFLFSRPLPESDFRSWMNGRTL
ncbi:GGDEF/EAL domain-containing response regulator [Spirochaeta isovalerica]|uniref:Diguanylate cyclase (GGDEF)-like protein n=1 Tax=Spirochaeta isovalerica TaxID=150 RepID=A0A841REJ7_9SPIO|nr:EAL domain-containing protein [Spirochaeta isovalerica]MBB6482413.1 diguanylate cyclase (GGDEF)-like protein [Spirochaeta isovalerica]